MDGMNPQGFNLTDAEVTAAGLTMENLEPEIAQELNKQDVDPQTLALRIMMSMGVGGAGVGSQAVSPQAASLQFYVTQNALATIIAFIKKTVESILRNPATRQKLRDACNAGGDQLCSFLNGVITKVLPWYLKWLAFLIPTACRELTGWVCSKI